MGGEGSGRPMGIKGILEASKPHIEFMDTGNSMILPNVSAVQEAALKTSASISAHTRQHAITQTLDHTSTATAGKILKADANGLPVDATNTDAAVSAAVTASHGVNDANATSQPIDSTLTALAALADAAGVLTNNGAGVLSWGAGGGGGDVTAAAALTDVFLIQGDGGVKGVKTTLISTANASDAVTKKHTQHTDTGTTGNTFTIDSDSATGKIILDVALGAADKSLTITNTALTDNRVATFQNVTGTIAYSADITTHAGLTTGVHGVGAGTIAKTADITKAAVGLSNVTDDAQITKALLTEQGDVIYASAASTPAALAHGTAGQVLQSGGHAANPSWTAAPVTSKTTLVGSGTGTITSAAVTTIGSFSTSGDIGDGTIEVWIWAHRTAGTGTSNKAFIAAANNGTDISTGNQTYPCLHCVIAKCPATTTKVTHFNMKYNTPSFDVDQSYFDVSAGETFYINGQTAATTTCKYRWIAYLHAGS